MTKEDLIKQYENDGYEIKEVNNKLYCHRSSYNKVFCLKPDGTYDPNDINCGCYWEMDH